MNSYDVIVLGGGTMGSAAAWALAKRNVRTLVLEQFHHVHSFGSHGGHTRVFRHAYSEGADYVPLMRRADDLWCQLGEELGLTLLHRVGILEVDAPGYHHAHQAKEAGTIHGIDYEWMGADEINRRWPAFRLPDSWEGGFSPIAGFIEVEPSLSGMAILARRAGVEIRETERAAEWGENESGVWVTTDGNTYWADRLIVTAGAWTSEVLRELGLPLTVVRKVLFWLDVERPAIFQMDRLPVFATDSEHGEIYGFPLFGKPGLKVANHLGGEPATPETINRIANNEESADCVALANEALNGVSERVLDSVVCMYTRTPDEHFIIDRHPGWTNVVFAAGFSGHGFKFAPIIGEHLADLALDGSAQPYPLFALDRIQSGAS